MSETIHKFRIPHAMDDTEHITRFEIEMPQGAKILSVARTTSGITTQHYAMHLWARVNTKAPKVRREMFVYGTGEDLTCSPSVLVHFVGTVFAGRYVWHVFSGIEIPV